MERERITGFYGEFRHALDSKSRIFIPSKLREVFFQYGKTVVLSRGLEKCLYLFPYKEWKALEEKTKSLPLTDRDARAYNRHLFSSAFPVALDSQGRIPLSPHLKTYARIDKEIVTIGVGDRVEIWSPQMWEEYFQKADTDLEDIADRLGDLGT